MVLPLKPHFFKKDGQKATIGGVEVNRQDAMTPRCQRNLASATALPGRRILKGFNHPAQGCATGATLGNKPHIIPYPERVEGYNPFRVGKIIVNDDPG
jgi:hypothetical protein